MLSGKLLPTLERTGSAFVRVRSGGLRRIFVIEIRGVKWHDSI